VGVAVGVVAAVGRLALVSHRPAHPARAHLAGKAPTVQIPESKLASRAPAEKPSPTNPAAAAGLRQGLLGYWRLDDGYGSQLARDSPGNGNACHRPNLDP